MDSATNSNTGGNSNIQRSPDPLESIFSTMSLINNNNPSQENTESFSNFPLTNLIDTTPSINQVTNLNIMNNVMIL